MITNMKSGKFSIAKVLIGLMMAVCLMAVFGFEQEESKKSKTTKVNSEQIQGKVYDEVEQMPEFIGGQSALMEFISQSVKYPPEASKKGIQGKVFVNFIVDKDGSVKNAKVSRGVDPLLDAEALRVINSMPKWIPGKEKGKVVAVQYTIPINFALK